MKNTIMCLDDLQRIEVLENHHDDVELCSYTCGHTCGVTSINPDKDILN